MISPPLLGRVAHVRERGFLDLDAAQVARGVSEADEPLRRAGDAAVEEDVRVAHDAVVHEAARGRDLRAVGPDLQDALVVLRAVVIAHLAGHRDDAGADEAGLEGPKRRRVAPVLRVLVALELDAPARDRALEAEAL